MSTPPAVGTPVRIRRRKYPDNPHYEMDCVVLGEDDGGTWAGSRKGSRIRMPTGADRPALYDAVFFIPHDDWFLAHFWQAHPEIEIYVDICTPATWTGDDLVVIDLDFDVIRWNASRGGGVELVDAEEFERHRVALEYPDDLEAAARRAAADVLERAERAEAPFRLDTAEPWLKQLLRFSG